MNDLNAVVFINEDGHARYEAVTYEVSRGKITFSCFQKSRGVELTVTMTHAEVLGWLDAHLKAGDLDEVEARDAREFLGEFI